MKGVLHDIRPALRALYRDRWFTAVVLATLGLAIGAVVSAYSIVAAVLLAPTAIGEPDRVVMLWESVVERGHAQMEVSYPNFEDWARAARSYAGMALISSINLDWTVVGGREPLQVQGVPATADFFNVLRARAARGRTFTSADDTGSGAPVVVVSDRLWRGRFGGRPDIVGLHLVVEGTPVTVIGVMPPDFDFPRGAEMWGLYAPRDIPAVMNRDARAYRVVARLRPGVTREAAAAEMNALAAGLASRYPATNKGFGVAQIGLDEAVLGNAPDALWVMSAAVLVVMLIACANIGTLLTIRVGARRREIAVRRALGADGRDIARRFLIEYLLLAGAAGVVGLFAAAYGVEVLARLAPADIPRMAGASIDGGAALAAAICAAATVLLFGLLPLFSALRVEPTVLLKQSGERGEGSAGGMRARNALVAAQIALAVTLLVGAGLFIHSFARMSRIDPGFDGADVTSVRLALDRSVYRSREQYVAFYTDLLARVERIPGVTSAALVLIRPLSGTIGWDPVFTVEGQDAAAQATNPLANLEAISPDYFRTMGIRMIAGRTFRDEDAARATAGVIVNRTFAERYWPGADAIGKRVKIGAADSKAPWMQVVGVAADVRYREWERPRPDLYVHYRLLAQFRTDIVVRSTAEPTAVARAVAREVYGIDRNQPITAVTTMGAEIDAVLARPRFIASIVGALAFIALALATVGVYGALAYAVELRRREIGVRIALGAGTSTIVAMVLRQAGGVITAGFLLGAFGAFVGARLVTALLYGVDAGDPLSYAGAALTLLLAAVAACVLPAVGAARVDPAVVLRQE